MIGAAEDDQMRTAGVVSRQADRLHDSLRSGHVEGDFVQPGDRLQPGDVVLDDRMVRAEQRTERPDAIDSGVDAVLVEVVSEKIDAVRSRQVVCGVPVEIFHEHAGRLPEQRAERQVLLDVSAVLERHAVRACELKIRQADLDGFAGPARQRQTIAKKPGESLEARAPLPGNLRRRPVGSKKGLVVVVVERDSLRQEARDTGVALERRVFGPRELQSSTETRKDRRRGSSDGGARDDSTHHDNSAIRDHETTGRAR